MLTGSACRSPALTQAEPLAESCEAAQPPKAKPPKLQLIVETFNSTSAAQAKKWLEGTHAHVVMLQEITSTDDDDKLEDFKGWATANGWKMLATASRRTDDGGISAGAAVLVRD